MIENNFKKNFSFQNMGQSNWRWKPVAEGGENGKSQAEGGAFLKPTPKAQGSWALSAEGRGIVWAKADAVIFWFFYI